MINVDQVWSDGITGKGISIRINDDGVDIDNQEFDGRFDEANSCDRFRPTAGDDDGHGTAVAGIVAGNANNVHCAAGIAYDSTFSACNAFVGGISFQNLNSKLESFDISQNSIGQP
jgi:subtilisin family serine protease